MESVQTRVSLISLLFLATLLSCKGYQNQPLTVIRALKPPGSLSRRLLPANGIGVGEAVRSSERNKFSKLFAALGSVFADGFVLRAGNVLNLEDVYASTHQSSPLHKLHLAPSSQFVLPNQPRQPNDKTSQSIATENEPNPQPSIQNLLESLAVPSDGAAKLLNNSDWLLAVMKPRDRNSSSEFSKAPERTTEVPVTLEIEAASKHAAASSGSATADGSLHGAARLTKDASSPVENMIHSCFNEFFTFQSGHYTRLVLAKDPSRIYLERVWLSPSPPSVNLTVVTHLSANRISQLEAQCRSWRGPLVAAVHLPLLQKNGSRQLKADNQFQVEEVAEQLDQVFKKMQSDPSACDLSLMLFWELFVDDKAAKLYPVNHLRNYAMLLAQTAAVAMVDVDLLVSSGLYDEFSDKKKAEERLTFLKDHNVLVIPAFETRPPDTNQEHAVTLESEQLKAEILAKEGKQMLLYMLAMKQAGMFAGKRFKPGHQNTDYIKWLTATDPYKVGFKWRFEPWYIVDRLQVPLYDIRFRGYFYNKAIQVAHLYKSGFGLYSHPTAYLMHRNHPAGAKNARAAKEIVKPLMRINNAKALRALHMMKKHRYSVTVDQATTNCLQMLPWWQGYKAYEGLEQRTSS